MTGRIPDVRAYVGVTDGDWFRFVAGRGLEEVNFWQPSGGRGFQALQPGELFLFKTHYRDRVSNQIVGGGFFLDHVVLTLREAWQFFGEGNGAPTMEDMSARIARYRREPIAPGEDPRIGCLILEGVRFFAESEYRSAPPGWSSNIVQGKAYETSAMEEYFGAILAQFFGQAVQRPETGSIPGIEEGLSTASRRWRAGGWGRAGSGRWFLRPTTTAARSRETRSAPYWKRHTSVHCPAEVSIVSTTGCCSDRTFTRYSTLATSGSTHSTGSTSAPGCARSSATGRSSTSVPAGGQSRSRSGA